MPSELIQQDGDSVDSVGAARKVVLDLFWCSAIVDVADEDAARVNVFAVFTLEAIGGGVEVTLHFAELRGF